MLQQKLNSKKYTGLVAALFLCLSTSSAAKANNMQSPSKSFAHFNSVGELIRPTGYREWVFIGAPLTPNDMNNGKAAFPEFHNVYIDPTSWENWKKTGEFSDGTVIVKELVSVGSKQAASGKGYFQGEYLGVEAVAKSKQHFPDTPGHWGFFRFTIDNSTKLKKVSRAEPEANCMACHTAIADKDQIFTQYYPVLRAAEGKGQAGTVAKD